LLKKGKKNLKPNKKIKINSADKVFDDEKLHEFSESFWMINIVL
jgi:hypothetical protein